MLQFADQNVPVVWLQPKSDNNFQRTIFMA